MGGLAEALVDEGQAFGGGMDRAFELGVLGGLEHDFEARSGFVIICDQIAAGDQELWAVLDGGLGFVTFFGGLPNAEFAVTGTAIQPVKLQVLIEPGKAKKAFEGGLLHLRDVAEAHVILDERDDLLGVFV